MQKLLSVRKHLRILTIVLLPAFAAAACVPSPVTPISTPVVKVVQVNRDVTVEVTRIVYVPVTVTPTPTPLSTDTPTLTPTSMESPTPSGTPVPPTVTLLIHTQCLYGPNEDYLGKYQILADSQQTVVGRSQDGSWVLVDGPDHKTPCWVKTLIVKVDSGDINSVQVAEAVLSPYLTDYPPPKTVSTYRVGNEVTIFWQPVPVAEADYNGYLVEALVCQGGQQVLIPQHYVPPFAKNDSMMAVKVTDEPGCSKLSGARIYTELPNGYSTWTDIVPWPQPEAAASATPTP
jgi:hypothetical protein